MRILPCPKGGTRFRPALLERGGKLQFPYLIDPNTGREMYESDDIVRYLYERYGAGQPSWIFQTGPLGDLSAGVASALRLGRGVRVEASRPPARPLELWSFEASPYCRIVREKLTTLEIPYLLHNVARGSPSREEFGKRSGRIQVPYLVDANQGVEMFESADIVAYLDATYGDPAPAGSRET